MYEALHAMTWILIPIFLYALCSSVCCKPRRRSHRGWWDNEEMHEEREKRGEQHKAGSTR